MKIFLNIIYGSYWLVLWLALCSSSKISKVQPRIWGHDETPDNSQTLNSSENSQNTPTGRQSDGTAIANNGPITFPATGNQVNQTLGSTGAGVPRVIDVIENVNEGRSNQNADSTSPSIRQENLGSILDSVSSNSETNLGDTGFAQTDVTNSDTASISQSLATSFGSFGNQNSNFGNSEGGGTSSIDNNQGNFGLNSGVVESSSSGVIGSDSGGFGQNLGVTESSSVVTGSDSGVVGSDSGVIGSDSGVIGSISGVIASGLGGDSSVVGSGSGVIGSNSGVIGTGQSNSGSILNNDENSRESINNQGNSGSNIISEGSSGLNQENSGGTSGSEQNNNSGLNNNDEGNLGSNLGISEVSGSTGSSNEEKLSIIPDKTMSKEISKDTSSIKPEIGVIKPIIDPEFGKHKYEHQFPIFDPHYVPFNPYHHHHHYYHHHPDKEFPPPHFYYSGREHPHPHFDKEHYPVHFDKEHHSSHFDKDKEHYPPHFDKEHHPSHLDKDKEHYPSHVDKEHYPPPFDKEHHPSHFDKDKEHYPTHVDKEHYPPPFDKEHHPSHFDKDKEHYPSHVDKEHYPPPFDKEHHPSHFDKEKEHYPHHPPHFDKEPHHPPHFNKEPHHPAHYPPPHFTPPFYHSTKHVSPPHIYHANNKFSPLETPMFPALYFGPTGLYPYDIDKHQITKPVDKPFIMKEEQPTNIDIKISEHAFIPVDNEKHKYHGSLGLIGFRKQLFKRSIDDEEQEGSSNIGILTPIEEQTPVQINPKKHYTLPTVRPRKHHLTPILTSARSDKPHLTPILIPIEEVHDSTDSTEVNVRSFNKQRSQTVGKHSKTTTPKSVVEPTTKKIREHRIPLETQTNVHIRSFKNRHNPIISTTERIHIVPLDLEKRHQLLASKHHLKKHKLNGGTNPSLKTISEVSEEKSSESADEENISESKIKHSEISSLGVSEKSIITATENKKNASGDKQQNLNSEVLDEPVENLSVPQIL